MYSLVPSVRRDVVLVQACGSRRNRWSHYYYGVIGTSSTSGLGMYLVLRYGEIWRFAETCSRPRFLHPRGDSTARVVCMYLFCQKSPLQGLGSDTKEIFFACFKASCSLPSDYVSNCIPIVLRFIPPSPLPHRIDLRLRSRTSHHYNSWLPY